MTIINQLEYDNISYPTDTEHPDSFLARKGTVCHAGCGLCSLCMIISQLGLSPLPLVTCRDLSMRIGANHAPGTDMEMLAPIIAARYDLNYEPSNSVEELSAWLKKDGVAIVNVGGDYPGHRGIFCDVGHFMAIVGQEQDEYVILDPAWTNDKYKNIPISDLVREKGVILYAKARALEADTANRTPAYYLFSRRKAA